MKRKSTLISLLALLGLCLQSQQAKAQDFTDSGIKAYVAVLDGKNITFNEVQQVPANTGVLLYAEGGNEEDVKIIDGGDLEVDGNSLVALQLSPVNRRQRPDSGP